MVLGLGGLRSAQGHPVAPADDPPAAARPGGEVIWAHATGPSDPAALHLLHHRLQQQRPGVAMVITCDKGLRGAVTAHPGALVAALPPDTDAAVQGFLDHWRPDICLWMGGGLRPVLIRAALRRGLPMVLAGARLAGIDTLRMRWLPDPARDALAGFAAIFAEDEATGQRLQRLGVSAERLRITGRLQEGGVPLSFDAAQRDDLAKRLAGRSVWLAARTHPDELPILTQAHRAALRRAHRSLLVIVPDDPDLGGNFASVLDEEGWRVARWSKGEWPSETTQIVLADDPAGIGLWYQLAPVTLMAHSLAPGLSGRAPHDAATLGSAILYGPNVGAHLASYTRFAAAGAARIVRDAATIEAALGQLMAPETAAGMAHAGWSVVSEGAEVTDALADLVQDALDLGQVP